MGALKDAIKGIGDMIVDFSELEVVTLSGTLSAAYDGSADNATTALKWSALVTDSLDEANGKVNLAVSTVIKFDGDSYKFISDGATETQLAAHDAAVEAALETRAGCWSFFVTRLKTWPSRTRQLGRNPISPSSMPGLSLDGACSVLRASAPSPLRLPEAFESCFDAIGEEGMMGRLPRSVDEVPTDLAGPGHEAALRKRLQRLGYLSAFHADRGVFDAAIRKFQEEAGLVVDGWTGARTWEALQELFTFENPFNAARWFGGDGNCCRPFDGHCDCG